MHERKTDDKHVISFRGKNYEITRACGCPNYSEQEAFKKATGHDYWEVYWSRVAPLLPHSGYMRDGELQDEEEYYRDEGLPQ